MFQQLKSLKPQNTIRQPRIISHSLEGSRKAQIVQIPITSRISPNSSTSPGFRQHIFLLYLKNDNTITSFVSAGYSNFLSVEHKIYKIRIRMIRTIYHTKTGTVCITITVPVIAIMTPISLNNSLLSLNADHPLTFYVSAGSIVQKLLFISFQLW